MYTWIYSSRGVSFSRETCRGPPRVHRETCTHARSNDTSVSARECEITRGDGRGQRLRATRVLEARQEPGPRAERPRDTGPCDLRREKGGGQEKGEHRVEGASSPSPPLPGRWRVTEAKGGNR